MKRSDIALIILIASISAVLAYFTAQAIFGSFSEEAVKVKTVEAISSQIDPPNTEIFNSNAINPSVEVNINNDSSE